MASRSKDTKDVFIENLHQACGIIAQACRQTGISRQTYYNWLNQDREFADRVEDEIERQKDIVESAIIKKITEGDTATIIFYAKCKMKDRGYTEKEAVVKRDEIDLSKLTDKEIAQYYQLRAKADKKNDE